MERPIVNGKTIPSTEIAGQLSLDTIGIEDQRKAFLLQTAREVVLNRIRGEEFTEAGPYSVVERGYGFFTDKARIVYKHEIAVRGTPRIMTIEDLKEKEDFQIRTSAENTPDRKNRRLNINSNGECSLEIDTYIGKLVGSEYSAAGEIRQTQTPHYHTETFSDESPELEEWIDQIIDDMTV